MDSVVFFENFKHQDVLSDMLSAFQKEMQSVDQTIRNKIVSDVATVPNIGNHIFRSGGKRLRPLLTLASARLTEYSGKNHITLAAAVELMHTATLLHDDVVDESDMRRGRQTARMGWGNAASVLVGDYLLGQAFRLMVSTGSLPALKVLSDAAAIIAEGEVLQLSIMNNLNTTEDAYMRVMDSKTAALFSASTEVGALIGNQGHSETAALASYGRNLGIAFQLVDDVLDYGQTSDIGKNAGDDFREGKITLPIILAYRRGNNTEREFWKRTIEARDQKEDDFEKACDLLTKYKTLEDTRDRAAHYGSIAKDALVTFRETETRQQMLDVINFCISRAY